MNTKNVISVLIILCAIAAGLHAQTFIQRSGTAEGPVFLLNEVGAILVSARDTVTVGTLLPAKSRPQGYESIDLLQDDRILMFNAERVKTVTDIQSKYNSLKVGDAVKLGIQRGTEMFIVSFEKIEPEKLPKDRKLIIRTAESGPQGAAGQGNVIQREIKIDGSEDSKQRLVGDSFILEETDSSIKITHVLPGAEETLGDLDVQEADVVLELNGTAVPTIKIFNETFDKIQTGDKVTLTLKRKDQPFTIEFKKPADDMRKRIIRHE